MATELVKRPVESVALSPLSILQTAVEKGADIDTIERLVALHERMASRDAEVQFNDAMNKAQAEIVRIAPDLTNPQTHSKYASYAALDKALRPVYIRHGFSLSFNSGESSIPETVSVSCYVSHAAGHTRTYQAPPMPSDGKGAKGNDVMSKTHATGAAMSYAMRYLLKAIFNIAVGEQDDDGNLGTNGELEEQLEFIENCRDKEELMRVYKAAWLMFEVNPPALKVLAAAKNKKLREF